jgi:hypothetical protein
MTQRRLWSFGAYGVLVGLAVSVPRAAGAASTAEQRTTAEALFQQGRELIAQKSFAAACEKFAASQELDPGLGIQLHLADCYDLAGKSASAWALFRDVATAARRSGEEDRVRIADERANELAARLSKVELSVVPAHVVAGLELRLNGVVIPKTSWNTALPFDPGPLQVEASAPGKKPWHFHGAIEPGPASRRVEIPALKDAPVQVGASSAAGAHAKHGADAPGASGSPQRALGYVAAGAGVVALAVGGFFGYRAYADNQRSKGECRSDDPNACTKDGVALRDDAQRLSTLSTIVCASGAAFVVGGVSLVLTAQTSHDDGAQRRAALTGVELGLRGAW